ncbi:GNAT family N-acetyltransferase [Halobaculum magnesiiphilum]|uniref:GNAT family N-acetyltransferase n=1 Tax=Halobaculum magnesiiphilum TaxID=1017351 RepID=A0A8T8WII7_9EURY|nr:GNAT family N-acetyltransferase [Halobaculum magnesiiphilum]QZP39692.1 GNAT family N-acetyltransferase [Halobaculum magnesiiphilum]
MSIEVRPVDDDERWNGYLEHAPTPTPFHYAEVLDVLASAAGATLHRLGGFKGQEPVGLFPVFEVDRGPVSGVFSPPPDLKVPYLGPTLVVRGDAPKRRRLDRQHHEFVERTVEHLSASMDPGLVNVRTPPGYDDVRPFSWNEYEADPRYTYVVDITRSEEELLDSFSSDARRNVTDDYDVDYEILPGDAADIERIVEQTRRRHAEQGEPFPIDSSFVVDLYEAAPKGVVRPVVCRIDGEFTAGTVCLEAHGAAIRWVGSAKPPCDLPANDLIDWEYCRRAAGRGVRSFDLAGANTPRIAEYKAKFAPDLVPYYRVKHASRTMDVAVSLYNKLR